MIDGYYTVGDIKKNIGIDKWELSEINDLIKPMRQTTSNYRLYDENAYLKIMVYSFYNELTTPQKNR
jgi:hypothetical protein